MGNPMLNRLDRFYSEFYTHYIWLLLGGLALFILIVAIIRWRKFMVNMDKNEGDVDYSNAFPPFNPKTFLPGGWSAEKDISTLKECCMEHKTYLGWRKKKRFFLPGYATIPVIIPDKERTYHCQVVGTTGSGKTETLFNCIAQDIIKGYGCCIVDPKSDDDFLEKLYNHTKACGLLDRFHFFSLMYPEQSHIYNPVENGTDEEITERIINAANLEVEYYKNLQFNFLLYTIRILRKTHDFITLDHIIDFMKNFRDKDWLQTNVVSRAREDVGVYLREVLKCKNEDVSGILAILNQVVSGKFSRILNGRTEIDLRKIINNGDIVLFQIPVMKYATIGKAIGKMILQDIQSVVGGRQSVNVDPSFKKKNFYPIYLDEFFSLAYPSFVELINKARSASVAIHLGHQSQADLASVSKEFKEAVFENTNIKIIGKQNDAASCEEFSKSFGTKTTVKETKAVTKGLLFNTSNSSSLREVEEFIIHPNLIKTAKVGQGVIKARSAQAYPCLYRMFTSKESEPFTPSTIQPKKKES